MKSISSKVMLLSTSFLFRFEAAYALSSNEPFPAFDRHGTHTHYTQILAPVPHLSHSRGVAKSSPRFVPSAESAMLISYQPQAQSDFSPTLREEYKLASVCFITDTTDCRGGNYDIPDYNICIEEGYDKTACPDEFYIPENYCPYDNKYFANCRDTCEGYVACNDPYYGVGEPCRGLYEKCECDTCPGYVFEKDIPRGYHKTGEACNSCDGPKYKYEINSCDGFMECVNTGPEDGAEICWRGDTPTYSSCKPCANLGDLDSCPAHYVCKYEECSKKYYKTGCEDGYIWDEAAKTCTPQCDPNDRTCQCPGKHFCDESKNQFGDGKTCTTADGTTYYEKCYVKETCFANTGTFSNELGSCYKNYKNEADRGSYYVNVNCTTQGGEKYANTWYCNETKPDCLGNMPPCSGKRTCTNNQGIGEPCECGKTKFFDRCDPCQELFDQDKIYENGGRCLQTTLKPGEAFNVSESYFVKERCTFQDGTKLIVYETCNSTWSEKDCDGNPVPCHGKIKCENDEGADGEIACECGGKKYFNKCKEMCMHSLSGTGSQYHYQHPEDSYIFSKGNYPVKEVCTRLDGKKVYTFHSCISTSLDGNGNIPPCAGMKECPFGSWGRGDPCTCGGRTYFNDCIAECTYEDTAEICAAKGQSFEQKCYGTKDGQQTWFGMCK